jgi:HD-GYP domain-containing protein (c-di-GMP phosphodiesterase class II)
MTLDRLREWQTRLASHHPGEVDHGERVAVYAVAAAHRLGWDDAVLQTLRFAAALHDVGKASLAPELLATSRPTGAQVLELRRHPELGFDLLLDELPVEGLEWIVAHHERWDGNGYPHGLHGEDIPFGARLIAVAETLDVLLHDGRWREPLEEAAALEEVRRCAGTQFDPEAVEAVLAVQPLIQPLVEGSYA